MATGVRAGEVLAILRAQNEMGPSIRQAQEEMRGLGGHIANAASTMAGFVGGTVVMGAVSSAFSVAKNAAFGMNSTLETTTLQFHSLGMTTDEAKKHVADLFQFAKETPFETGPIIEASRQLRVFGGANLDTVANLRLFGDTSAATNADLGALTFWFGRLYSAAQAGKPFGEALQNLQQLGVLSPQAVTQLSNMSEKGAKFGDVWKLVTGDLQRFHGAMKDQAGTWKGLTSTISDAINIMGAQVLQPFFKMAEQGAGRLADALSSPRVTQAATQLSHQLGEMLGRATREGGTALGMFQSVLKTTGDPIAAVDAVLVHLASALGLPQPLIVGLNSVLLTAAETMKTVGGVARDILVAAFERLGPPLSRLSGVILTEVLPPLDTLITKGGGWVAGADDGGTKADVLAKAIDGLAGPLKAAGAVLDTLATNFDKVKVALGAAVVVWATWRTVLIVTTAAAWAQTAAIYAYVAATYAQRGAIAAVTATRVVASAASYVAAGGEAALTGLILPQIAALLGNVAAWLGRTAALIATRTASAALLVGETILTILIGRQGLALVGAAVSWAANTAAKGAGAAASGVAAAANAVLELSIWGQVAALVANTAGWVANTASTVAGQGVATAAAAVQAVLGSALVTGTVSLIANTAGWVANAVATVAGQVATAASTAALYLWTGAQVVANLTQEVGLAGLVAMTAAKIAGAAASVVLAAATAIVTAAQWAWNVAMTANPIGLVIVAIAALIIILVLLVTHWDQVTAAVQTAWRWFLTIYDSTGPLGAALHVLVGPIVELIRHWGDLTWAIGTAWSAIQNFAGSLSHIHIPTPHFNVNWQHVGVGDVGVDIPSISFGGWYQKGAIFTRPTLIGIAENGPEGVFPLPRGYNPASSAAAMGLVNQAVAEGVNDHLLGAPNSGRRGMVVVTNTFNITGAQDPEATWRLIERRLNTMFQP